jgi:LysM repeat protein
LGNRASSASTKAKRILPIAAPTALAGLAAAAFAFGHSSGAVPAVTDAAGLQSAGTAGTVAATPQASASAAQLLSLIRTSATAGPVVTLHAAAPAGKHHATAPKGKHHATGTAKTQTAKYTVQPGDTLASIAQHLYHSAAYWPVLYSANHSQIKDANAITAGQVLTVPPKPAKVPAAPKQAAPAPVATTTTDSYSSASTSAPSTTSSTSAASTSTAASTGSTSSFQACVIARESGGNSQIMNSSGHYGLYQFSSSTWAEYGGSPAEFGNATVAEQNAVFANAMAAGGEFNWAPYDGC